MKKHIIVISFACSLISCQKNTDQSDASGTFEANETIISSEIGGKILTLNINEGDTLAAGQKVGQIDMLNLTIQKEQIESSIESLPQKFNDPTAPIKVLENQIDVQKEQLRILEKEHRRITNLVKSEAAPSKQLDDIEGQIALVKKQIQVLSSQITAQKTQVALQNRGINSEKAPLEKRVAQLNDQISRANIVNPIKGTVLTKYAETYEVTAPGKALYKIADLSTLTLRAYLSGSQLPKVKLNQTVKVLVDNGTDSFKELTGQIYWIADKAEFTPKTIQTKEERANLVYAVKIRVKNDGYLKLGMYGEIKL
ncbi:HlyD family secretion protein [Flectobacillus major]|uniref:HlyD family secretion protein n=1 Tax=Flectobacillus major TaxID=103 RepID=UPI00041AE3FC|nr:HlyD family efflux transporter periplasmic adaptor subunit [Flectobacillus major]